MVRPPQCPFSSVLAEFLLSESCDNNGKFMGREAVCVMKHRCDR
jgi:hypothetical protein